MSFCRQQQKVFVMPSSLLSVGIGVLHYGGSAIPRQPAERSERRRAGRQMGAFSGGMGGMTAW